MCSGLSTTVETSPNPFYHFLVIVIVFETCVVVRPTRQARFRVLQFQLGRRRIFVSAATSVTFWGLFPWRRFDGFFQFTAGSFSVSGSCSQGCNNSDSRAQFISPSKSHLAIPSSHQLKDWGLEPPLCHPSSLSLYCSLIMWGREYHSGPLRLIAFLSVLLPLITPNSTFEEVTGSSKKNPAKFSDTGSVRADGLFIGCLGQWAERGRENSNMQEFFLHDPVLQTNCVTGPEIDE